MVRATNHLIWGHIIEKILFNCFLTNSLWAVAFSGDLGNRDKRKKKNSREIGFVSLATITDLIA